MNRDIEILQFLQYNPEATRPEIASALSNAPSPATLKRLLADCVSKGHIKVDVPLFAVGFPEVVECSIELPMNR